MKRTVLAVLVMLVTSCSTAHVGGVLSGGGTSRQAWSAALDDSRGAVLKVINNDCQGTGSGSGFVYAPHTLITNRHVVAGAQSLSVLTQGGHALDVTIADASTVDDIAIVHTRQELPHPLALADTDPTPGDLVRALGFPLGGPFTATSGRVIDYSQGGIYGRSSRVLRSSASIRPGNSGGPLVDARSHVAGVVFAIDTVNGDTLVIPVSRLRQVLADRTGFTPVSTTC